MSSGIIEMGLANGTLNTHRALASLQEELEAIDYYHQRVDLVDDDDLKSVLAHNRDDEMEHAVMLMEWLRRTMPGFDFQMKKLLFTTGDLISLAKETRSPAATGSGLGLLNLK